MEEVHEEINSLMLGTTDPSENQFVVLDFGAKKLARDIYNSASLAFEVQLVTELFRLDPDLHVELPPESVVITVNGVVSEDMTEKIRKAISKLSKKEGKGAIA